MSYPLPPAFHRLAGANLAAQAAEQVSLAAVPIIAVLLQAGPGQIGLVLACAGFCVQAGVILASPVRTLQRLPPGA